MSPAELASLILALSAFLTAAGTFLRGVIKDQREKAIVEQRSKNTERRDQIDMMNDIITNLQGRVNDLETGRNELEKARDVLEKELTREKMIKIALFDYIASLRALMIENHIKVPDMPKME